MKIQCSGCAHGDGANVGGIIMRHSHDEHCNETVIVPTTGTFLVRNGVVEQGHFDSFGRWCDCEEVTHA